MTWDDGISIGLGEHSIELRAAKIQGATELRSREVGVPNFQRRLLQLIPGKCTESIGTGKPCDVVTGTADVVDGCDVHAGHYAAV